nr:aldehyde dehydrogenase family protein [Paracoccaceae bacterium]
MTVKDIFETMEYGPAREAAGDALAWITDQGARFGHFIDGAFTTPREGFDSTNPATGEVLATLTQASAAEVDAAVAAARKAQPGWEKLGGKGRARYLYALARLLQKHSRLFAVLETLDNGKPIRESRDIDVPLAQRHFYYHAGMAQL